MSEKNHPQVIERSELDLGQDGAWPAVYKEYDPDILPSVDAAALASMVGLLTELGAAEGEWLCERIAWPVTVVEDHGRTVGFLTRATPDRFLETFADLLNDDRYGERDRLSLLNDLASVLHRLHRIGIVVGDLSPRNLLFTMHPRPECFFVDCDAMQLRGVGVLPGTEEKATRASDVYNFGLLAVRLFARDETSTDPAALAAVHPALAALARTSLDPDPAQRPTLVYWTELLSAALARASTVSTAPTVTTPIAADAAPTATIVPPAVVRASVVRASVVRPPVRLVGASRRRGVQLGGLIGLAAVSAAVALIVTLMHSHPNQGAATDGAGVAATQVPVARDGQSSQPTDTPSAGDSGSATATQTSSSPMPTGEGIVQLGQGVQADPRAVAVGNMLNTYFNGIDTRNYQSAVSVEDPAGGFDPSNPSEVQKFAAGVQTTQDSQIDLVSLSPSGGGTTSPAATAVVTFQSTQQPGYGPAGDPNQTCTKWALTYVLTAQPDGSYLIHNVQSAADHGC